MNAEEAFGLSKQHWAEHEEDYLKHIIGFQSKVENAAKEGRVACHVTMLPMGSPSLVDFVTAFFEQQGYFVVLNGTSTGEISVGLNWKQLPLGSRASIEATNFRNAIS
jgi:hypothetical protein